MGLLEAGSVDIAVTYNEAAELQKMKSGAAIRREYGFRVRIHYLDCTNEILTLVQDHFLLVGPSLATNPADLKEQDDVLEMFSKIVVTGNAHVTVSYDLSGRLHVRLT